MNFFSIYGKNTFVKSIKDDVRESSFVNSFLETINLEKYFRYDSNNDACYYSIFGANLYRETAFSCDLSKKLESHALFQAVPKNNIITTQGDAGLNRDKNGNIYYGHQTRKFMYVNPDDIFNHFDNWYAPNLKSKISSIMPIPVGPCAGFANVLTPSFIRELRAIPKTKLCYCNLSITSRYRTEIAKWANATDWIDDFIFKRGDDVDKEYKNDNSITFAKRALSFPDYMRELATYKFAVVPEGHGVDTFRLWECILTNTIPIVQNNYGNQIFSEIFPMVMTDRYETLTRSSLTNTGEERTDLYVADENFSPWGEHLNYNYSLLHECNLHELLRLIKNVCDRT